MNLNKVLLVGRLAADPEMRATPSGQQVANIRVATSRTWNDQNGVKQEQTEFHNVVVWGKQAENVGKYLIKGQLVQIEGRLQNRSWQAQDGTKRFATDVVADTVQFGPKAAGGSMGGAPTQGPSSSFQKAAPVAKTTKAASQPKEDEIPIINEDFPISNPMVADTSINEVEIDLKDIPF